jgi:Predicted signal-transduction protein containing cAMP-binding and CBS domains
MTPNPKCHAVDASINLVAKTMRDDNIGPVLIVDSLASMRLEGIITDRDIAIYVVAEDRDPRSTMVKDVMSAHPTSCLPETDVLEALRIMEELQIRRIPVVDNNTCLIGIISQADIANRLKDRELVGEVVEEISKDGKRPPVRQATKDA